MAETEVLSHDEIDALLDAITSGGEEPEDSRSDADIRKITLYDFNFPYKITKEQLRSISRLHEFSFARMTSTLLSQYFRTPVHIHVACVHQDSYEQYIKDLSSPTTLCVIDMSSLGNIVIEIDPDVSCGLINLIFGGEGVPEKQLHELTDIEKLVMRETINKILPKLSETWKPFIDIDTKLLSIETTPQFVKIVPPNEMSVLISLEISFNDLYGMIKICYPYSVLEPVVKRLTAQYRGKRIKQERIMEVSAKTIMKDALQDVNIMLTVELGRTIHTLKEILGMGEGSIMELDKLAGEPLDIFANNKLIAKGEVVVIDENFGVRLTDVCSEMISNGKEGDNA